MNWKYTHIHHPARIKMGLKISEYCVLDIIYQSQTHPSYSIDGWAKTGCHKIAEFLGLSSGTVHAMLKRFKKWGFLEIDEKDESLKRTTGKFYDSAYLEKAEDVQKLNVQKLNRGCSKTEQGGVQKLNGKCSKTEPKVKEVELSNGSIKSDPAFSITETEIDFEPFEPNQPEKEKEKKVAAKKEKPLVHQMFDTWSEYHEQLFDEPAASDAKFFKHLKLLADKFEARLMAKEELASPENIIENFRLFLQMIIDSKESFYLTNFTPDIFNSKFTNLIQLFKSRNNEQRSTRRRKENLEILAEIAARTVQPGAAA